MHHCVGKRHGTSGLGRLPLKRVFQGQYRCAGITPQSMFLRLDYASTSYLECMFVNG